MRRTALLVALVTGVLATAGTPARAHGDDAPSATAYRIRVTAVTPAAPGLTVRAVEAGARLELINRTGRTVQVLGYSGEPYLQVRPDGTDINVNSPATYLNETLAGDTAVPATATPTATPQWRRVSGDARVRWHDQRTYWTDHGLPALVAADPSREHRLRDWVVPLRDGATTTEVHGTLDWLPPPTPAWWWAGALLLAGCCVAARRSRGLLVVVTAVAGTTTLGYAVGRTLDAGVSGLGDLLGAMFTDALVAVLVGLGALGAAALAAARRPIGDFALAVAGAAVAVFAGLPHLGVFTEAVTPVVGPGWWARAAVLITLGAGAAVVVAAVLRLRAAPDPVLAPADAARPGAAQATAQVTAQTIETEV